MRISLICNTAQGMTDKERRAAILSLPFGKEDGERLLNIKNADAQYESLCARIALLKLCCGGDIALLENGKPYFVDEDKPSFNLSHTRGISCAAVSERDEGEIGIDIEAIDGERPYKRIAERFFTKDELDTFTSASETAEAFFLLWTEKEARSKLSGHGLSRELAGKATRNDIYLRRYEIRLGDVRAFMCVASENKAEKIDFACSDDFLILELK